MPEASIRERSDQIAEEFEFLPDWTSRYEYLISMGDDIPRIPEEEKTEETYVHGCQSDVWIKVNLDTDEGLVRLRGDTSAKLTTGLAALLIRLLDRQPPQVIADADLGVLDEIGLRDRLSAQRRNGLASMIEQMKSRVERLSDEEVHS